MIIETIEGDIVELLKRGYLVAHGCNCFHAMNGGIAYSLSKEFSGIPLADKLYSMKGDKSKLGDFTTYFDDGGGICFNLYTQFFPGKDASYKYIEKAFKNLNDRLGSSYVYIPKIGAGIGGLEWEKVKEVIDKVTPRLSIVVVEYKGFSMPHDPTILPRKSLEEMLHEEEMSEKELF